MVAEVSVSVRNEEKRQTHKYVVYEAFTCNEDDPYLKSLVESALKEFNAEADDISIKIKMVVR